MKHLLSKVCWLTLIVAIGGCDIGGREPQKTVRAITRSMEDLADILHSVRDADSARTALSGLDQKFATLCDLMGKMPALARQYPNGMSKKDSDAMKAASARVKCEGERLNSLSGLPIEFWKITAVRGLDLALAGFEVVSPEQAAQFSELIQHLKNLRELYRQCPFEEVLTVQLTNLNCEQVNLACDKLQKLAPNARLYHFTNGSDTDVTLGPVKDFKAVASAIDFGNIVVQNESRRSLTVAVNWHRLDPNAYDPQREAEKRLKEGEERAKAFAEQSRRTREEMEQRRKEFDGNQHPGIARLPDLDPNAPDYYDKLADRVNSEGFSSNEAIKVLLSITPSQVSSLETRKKIARAFKQLAENESCFVRVKAIKGLVIWGGKFSGPILLRMLNEPHSFEEEQVIIALGDIKYGPAASALAARLGNFSHHQRAFNALRELGEDAEDALIRVAPSENPRICLAAVDLLADCGTAKCLPLLNKGLSSRNMEVREASKLAIRKVKDRIKQAKAEETDSDS